MTIVGEIRPSQLMFSFGVGAVLDLPEFSALVLGLDYWDRDACAILQEPRLLAAVQGVVGRQLRELRLPPVKQERVDAGTQNIPVAPFPRWMRCTACGCIAPIEDGAFTLQESRFEPPRYEHTTCVKRNRLARRNPRVVPVRFLMACKSGHLMDVPWNEFVHGGSPCASPHLTLREYGNTGEASDIVVQCQCGKRKQLSELIYRQSGKSPPFKCQGLHPHLRLQEKNCEETPEVINLGASNMWFPQSISVLSIPDKTGKLFEAVRKNWKFLSTVTLAEEIGILVRTNIVRDLQGFAVAEILSAIEAERNPLEQQADAPSDVKQPEWEVFAGIRNVTTSQALEVRQVDAPQGFEDVFERTTLAPRLTEVRAMFGFTRITTQQELDLGIVTPQKFAQLSRSAPAWVPAYESHGEGVFLRFREEALQDWEQSPAVKAHNELFLQAHRAWRKSRNFEDVDEGYPGMRFVLLHSFAHALMQQIVLDCGYSAASIRERLYCRQAGQGGDPMAGILLYTAATDSEGTLGGLVSLGDPSILGRNISQALENMKMCTSDPLCAERKPEKNGRNIHGATCHACLFMPETSCECGNRYLDRNVLVKTFASSEDDTLPFWGTV